MPSTENIFHVVRQGDLLKLKEYVLKNRNQVFISDRNGQTALHIAASEGFLDEAAYLIECGCFVHVYDKAGRVPFHCAVRNNHQDMATYLLEMGTFPHMNTRSEDTALHLSIDNSLQDMSDWLISLGANLHYKNRDGDTPLHRAAFGGHVSILRNMMKFSPDLEIINNTGDTPFMKAATWGHLSAIQFLYESGANIHHINFKGDSSLHVAAIGGSISVVKWLLLQGVSITGENLAGHTAQDVARTGRIKQLLQNVYDEGLGVIYNKGKESSDEIKQQQEEEAKVKVLLREECKEEMNLNARLLLEKELILLNTESAVSHVKSAPKIKKKANTGKQPATDQWATYNGELVEPEDVEEEKDFEIEELAVLGNLMSRRRHHVDVNAAPAGMVHAPSSCASGVTDTAGTTIAGHRSDDTLSDDTELNDSMFSHNSSDFWNERANHYLRRMKNFAKKLEDLGSSSSDEEDSVTEQKPTTAGRTPATVVEEGTPVTLDDVVFNGPVHEDDEEYEQNDLDDVLSRDPRVDEDGGDSSDEEVGLPQDLSMMAHAGARSDTEIDTLNEDGSGVSDATLKGSGEGSGSDCSPGEQMSFEKLVELQDQELKALISEQQKMLSALQQSQQEEANAEMLALSNSANSELDDKALAKFISDMKEKLTAKHSSELSQLWNDHQTTLNAMRETHKFEQMSFSFEYGNNEGDDKNDDRNDVNNGNNEESIEELRTLLRDSGVSPSGLQASPSGMTSVKEEGVEANVNEMVISNTVESPEQQHVIDDIDEGNQGGRHRKKRQSKERSPNKLRLSKSPMTGKSGVKMLQKGKLAAGLGRSALQSLLGEGSDSDSGNDESSTSDITISSSEYYTSDNDSCISSPENSPKETTKRTQVMQSQPIIPQQQPEIMKSSGPPPSNASSKRTLNSDLAAEKRTPPPPVKESLVEESSLQQSPEEIITPQPISQKSTIEQTTTSSPSPKVSENVKAKNVVVNDTPVTFGSTSPKPDDDKEKPVPKSNTPSRIKTRSRLSTGSRRSSNGSVRSDQRMMATGRIAAGLGGTMLRSFMCNSDSDMSTREDDSSFRSRSSSLSSGIWSSASRDSQDDDSIPQAEARKYSVPDTYKVQTEYGLQQNAMPVAYKVQTEFESRPKPRRIKMSASRTSAPVPVVESSNTQKEKESDVDESGPYKVETVYDLSPVEVSKSQVGDNEDEQSKISILEDNIVALRAMLQKSGVSPNDLMTGPLTQENLGTKNQPVEDPLAQSLVVNVGDVPDNEQQLQQQRVEEESKRVFELIDLNKDGVVSKIELIKGLKRNSLNLPEILHLPRNIRQEDGSRDHFMSVFHAMDKNNSSDISLSEFVDFCQNVHIQSKNEITPMILSGENDVHSDRGEEDDDNVGALKVAAGEAMQSTVAMLKRVMEDRDFYPTPDKEAMRQEVSGGESTSSSDNGSRAGTLTPRSRVLTPMISTVSVGDLSTYKTLATKLSILASYLLTESRASTLRNISDQISHMVSEIEENDEEDEWGESNMGTNVDEQMTQLTMACREWKVEALAVVRGEIHSLEERVSQIYTVFLE